MAQHILVAHPFRMSSDAPLAAGLLLLAALVPSGAAAEVCDKIGDGPIGPSGPAATAVIAVALALVWRTASGWIAFPSAILCGLLALAALSEMASGDPFFYAARLEGCRSFLRSGLDIAALLGAASAFIWLWSRKRGSASIADKKK